MACVIAFCAARAWAADCSRKEKFSLGVVYTGLEARLGLGSHWAAEARYLFDQTNDDSAGEVRTQVAGARLYHFPHSLRKLRLYWGLEAGFVSAEQTTRGNRKSTGGAAGIFAGLEYYVSPRVSISLDGGPYYLSLTEKASGRSDSDVTPVFNSGLNFYFF